MELRQRLQMKLAQKLVMTPNLQLAIRLLQLNKVELQEAIAKELMENPLLEVEDACLIPGGSVSLQDGQPAEVAAAAPDAERLSEVEWEQLLEDDYYRHESGYEEHEPIQYENILTRSATLEEHLIWQLNLSSLDPIDHRIGLAIIGDVNDDGYLTSSIEEIALKQRVPVCRAEAVLEIIQGFDPPGIGARNVRECLLLQIRQSDLAGGLAEKLVVDHLPLLERHAYPQLARELAITVPEVLELAQGIRRLEPKPGRAHSSHRVSYIEPDVYISKVDDEYVVQLSTDGIPRLRVSSLYRSLLLSRQSGDGTRQYVEQKLASARWLIRSIEQRQRTVYKVAESILRFQRDFFEMGIAHLKPLVLRDVADDIGMHESTVSRVSTNKYMHTPQGIFEIKYFFHSGLESQSGEDISSIRVKQMIKEIISAEDPQKPYSDKRIGDLVAKRGVRIARRTVAKYREELKILPSSRRKAYS